MKPFDYVNSITDTKKNLMVDEETKKAYLPYIVNRSLSYFPDTVLFANEMNKRHHLESDLQYSFLINTIRKRKRFSKWEKSGKIEDIEVIKEYYEYSNDKARTVLPLLTQEQLLILREKVNKGGRRK